MWIDAVLEGRSSSSSSVWLQQFNRNRFYTNKKGKQLCAKVLIQVLCYFNYPFKDPELNVCGCVCVEVVVVVCVGGSKEGRN